ncbi:MAG: UDPGP type 1 family protein [Opitutales bacterium]|nr:UDPGP type 1 family protein [Opitutales bacterium]
MTSLSANALVESFTKAGQGQVFRFADTLGEDGLSSLLAAAAEIDLDELASLCESLLPQKSVTQGGPSINLDGLQPAPYIPLPEEGGDAALWDKARKAGEDALRAGRVAAFVVAGGQGTRLGYEGPKGCYPATPVRQASLFQVFAEKIRAASARYGKSIPWLIMTSSLNDAATRKFFEDNSFFGLPREDVIFFMQGRMPAVDARGKILLDAPDSIAMSPNGHGGSLRAVVTSGAAQKLRTRGVDMISYWQVDNPLVQIIDPAFIGFHVLNASEMSSKMIPKAYPLEKVGHFCLLDGKNTVVEYSDLPNVMQEQLDEQGQIRFRAGSVAIHIFDLAFVERLGGTGSGRLPFHLAHKKIAYVDEAGTLVKPERPNGFKFEMFVFDALPFAERPVIIEGKREDEFSPIKNAEGVDSPASCRRDQIRQWVRWAKAAGIVLPVNEDGITSFDWEVSPLFADSEAAFVQKWNSLEPKPQIAEGTLLV